MALAAPKKKKIIPIIIIILSLVQTKLDSNIENSFQEQVSWKLAQAVLLLDALDEENWTSEQTALWNVIDGICNAHSPEATSEPDDADYEQWAAGLDDALGRC